jgi:hypothetical protein
MTPLGRREDWEDSPEGYAQSMTHAWVRRDDEYDASAKVEASPSSAFTERENRSGQRRARPSSP